MTSSSVKQGVRFRSSQGGFSLVETVIALAIVAVTLVPVIGLMPIGMNTYRHASDQMAGALIAQQLSGEYDVGTTEPATQQRYFDNMGQETGTPSGATTVYYVNVVKTSGFGLPGDPSSGSGRLLNQIQVEVWYNPAHTALTTQSNGLLLKSPGQQIREYSFYVAQ